MQTNMTVIPASGIPFNEIGKTLTFASFAVLCSNITVEEILQGTDYRGFPVVQDKNDMTLIGYIGRSELLYLLGKIPEQLMESF